MDESVSEHVGEFEAESLCEFEVYEWDQELGAGEGVGMCRRLSEHLGEGALSEVVLQALGSLHEGHVAFPLIYAVAGPGDWAGAPAEPPRKQEEGEGRSC